MDIDFKIKNINNHRNNTTLLKSTGTYKTNMCNLLANDTLQFDKTQKHISFGKIIESMKSLFSSPKKENGVIILPTITQNDLVREKNREYKKQRSELVKLMKQKNCPEACALNILQETNVDNIELAILLGKKFGFYYVGHIPKVLHNTTSENIHLAQKLYEKMELYQLAPLLACTTVKTSKYIENLYNNKNIKFNPFYIAYNLKANENDENLNAQYVERLIKFAEKLETIDVLSGSLSSINPSNIDLAETFLTDQKFPKELNEVILRNTNSSNAEIIKNIIIPQIEKCYEHPDLYVNGEFDNEKEYKKEVTDFWCEGLNSGSIYNGIDIVFNENNDGNIYFELGEMGPLTKYVNKGSKIELFTKSAKAIGAAALDDLLRHRFEDAEESYLFIIGKFDDKDLELLKAMCDATKPNGEKFISTEKLAMIDLLNVLKIFNYDLYNIKEMINNNALDIQKLNMDLLGELFRKIGLTEYEIMYAPKEKQESWDLKYMPLLAKEEVKHQGNYALVDLMKASILNDFSRYIHDKNNPYGMANLKTKEMFAKCGLNYDAWFKLPKTCEENFSTNDSNTDKFKQISIQLIEDMEVLRKTPAKNFIDKIFAQFIKDDKFTVPANIISDKEKLANFVKNIHTQLQTLWKRAEKNSKNDNPEISARAKNVLTIKSHILQKIADIQKTTKINEEKSLNWKIKMWDRNPAKDIFQGNYSTCCIGLGNANSHAMPNYILNTMFNMIEIQDEKNGKVVGNALCYYTIDFKGKLFFAIDNVEIANKYKLSYKAGIKLRNTIKQFAINMNKQVAPNQDIPIILGTNFNDITDFDLEEKCRNLKFLGDMECDEIYADLFEGWNDKNVYKQVEYYLL